MIEIVSSEGDNINAYMAIPNTKLGPGVTILSDPLVLEPWTKNIADEFSMRGYLVCVPELRWNNCCSTQSDSTQIPETRDTNNSFSKFYQDIAIQNRTMAKIEEVFNKIRTHPACNGKIASVGFSWGGTLSFLAAARLEPDVSVAFYATHMENYLQEGRLIDCQTVLHMGKQDRYITEKITQKIHAALIGKFNIAIYLYEVGHGFANSQNLANFHPEAKTLAFQRTFNLIDSLK